MTDIDDDAQIMLCNTEDRVKAGLLRLRNLDEVAFDSEGDDLGRDGPMTLLQLSSTESSATVYIFDVQALGPDIFDITINEITSLRAMLESKHVLKVTFDCRSDSDALQHQFGVTLTNVLDTQVFHQGIRRTRMDYRGASKDGRRRAPYLQGMKKCAEYYLDEDDCRALGLYDEPPHKEDNHIWTRFPRSIKNLRYAANDCSTINNMLKEMRSITISPKMMRRIIKGSNKYVAAFRKLTRAVEWPRDKKVFLVEAPI